ALLFRNVPPPLPREGPTRLPVLASRCLLPSPRHDGLGPSNHLSAEILTRLARRSLGCGPLPCSPPDEGSRRSARPRGSLHATGACYPALRRLPGRDFHPLETRSFHDAPWQRFLSRLEMRHVRGAQQ